VVDDLTVEDNVRVVLDPLRLSHAQTEQAVAAALDYTGILALRPSLSLPPEEFCLVTELCRSLERFKLGSGDQRDD
jgi:hypothetical protein